jgi:TRAP-type C4-dicarboxylate transport system substrate-binding protein
MRKTILATTAVALSAFVWTTVGAAPASAQEVKGPKVSWKINVWGKKRAFTADLEAFAAIAKKKTNGNFKIKVFYGDQLGGKKQNLDNLKSGVFDASKVCWSYHPGKVQSMTVLNLPFLPVTNFDVQRKVAEAVYKHDITKSEMKDKWNIFALSSSQLPQYEFMGRGDAPKTIKGWNGLTVRALGGLADAMRKLGASVSTMTATEVYQAIDRGAVNAVSFPFSYAHSAYKIDEVAEWFTINLAPGTNDCPNVVSLKSWNALPEQYRKLLLDAKDDAYEALRAAYSAKDKVNIPKWKSKLIMVKYTDEELAGFRKVGGQPVYDKWIATNKDKFDAKGLLDFVMKTAKSGS